VEGISEGLSLGVALDGTIEGAADGDTEGSALGTEVDGTAVDGIGVRAAVGAILGESEGVAVLGSNDGDVLGITDEGATLGQSVGESVGASDGADVGAVGKTVGEEVGVVGCAVEGVALDGTLVGARHAGYVSLAASRVIAASVSRHKLDGISPPIELLCSARSRIFTDIRPRELGIVPVKLFF
jgi:hypothetical protein